MARKRCPNGTRRQKSGECVKKSIEKKTPHRGGIQEYIVTFYNSNGNQIKDMDMSVDDPLELVEKVESMVGTGVKITPLQDKYIPQYIAVMGKDEGRSVDDDEMASVWYCKTAVPVLTRYETKYDNKSYIVKFNRI